MEMTLTLSMEDREAIAAMVVEQISMRVLSAVPSMQPRGLSEPEAAAYIGVSEKSLRNSRSSGMLGKVPAPSWRKNGRKVTYLTEDLDAWLESLDKLRGGKTA